MRRRHNATLRLETMEDRVVPSTLGVSLSPSTTAEIHKLGVHLRQYASSAKNDLNTLIQHRTGQATQTGWQTHHTHSHHTSHNLFGIPFFKI